MGGRKLTKLIERSFTGALARYSSQMCPGGSLYSQWMALHGIERKEFRIRESHALHTRINKKTSVMRKYSWTRWSITIGKSSMGNDCFELIEKFILQEQYNTSEIRNFPWTISHHCNWQAVSKSFEWTSYVEQNRSTMCWCNLVQCSSTKRRTTS